MAAQGNFSSPFARNGFGTVSNGFRRSATGQGYGSTNMQNVDPGFSDPNTGRAPGSNRPNYYRSASGLDPGFSNPGVNNSAAYQRSGEVIGGSGGFIWKPFSQGGLNTGKGTAILPASFSNNVNSVHLIDASGNVLDQGKYRSTSGDNRGIWDFGKPGSSYPAGTKVRVTLDSGEQKLIDLSNPGARNEDGKSVAGGGGGGSGAGGGSVDATALPTYIGDQYPHFNPIDFPTINPADYKFTDPIEFANKFGDANRAQIGKNFTQAQGFALDSLNTELQGLESFAPAAAALKRGQTSVDNQFNQAQREAQVNGALPNARGDLNNQRDRALAYASGRIPDQSLDNAFELGTRSSAADAAGFSGIGPHSGEAVKTSDLMSADKRLQLSQFGEGLFSQNLSTQANLFLAPTEYSDAGTQIRVNPEVGAGRLTQQGLGTINEATLVSPGAALSSEINQNQFVTNSANNTNQFNASGKFAASEYNSSGQFAADLGKFQYDVAFQNAVQAANQSILTNSLNAGIVEASGGAAAAGFNTAQNAATIQSTIQGIGALPGAVNAISGALGALGITGGGQTAAPAGVQQTSAAPVPIANATAPSVTARSTEAGISGQNVGGSSVDTSPSQSGSSQGGNAPISQPIVTSPMASAPLSTGVSLGSPSALQFPSAASVPQGYAPVSTGGNGMVTAANIDSYGNELARFASLNSLPHAQAVSVPNAATADQALSSAANISYHPVQGFQQIGLTSSGAQVYSSPQAATNGDISVGQTNLTNTGLALATLGQTDPKLLGSIGELSRIASNPQVISSLDEKAQDSPEAVTKHLAETMLGGKIPYDTKAGQQFGFMAARTGELWSSMSPYQKSASLAALAGPALQVKTGEDIATRAIPGSEKSVAGKLTVGDTLSLTAQGKNGYALARNWNQLSALGNIVGGTKGVTQIAGISEKAGALGFGVQGASVPVEAGALKKAGATSIPAFGVGAMVFPSDGGVPKNYKIVSRTPDNNPIALPGNLVKTSPFSSGSPHPLSYAKATAISDGTHPAQRIWGKPPLDHGMYRGSAGGSALVSSISQMVDTNPSVASAMIAYAMMSNHLGGGDGTA